MKNLKFYKFIYSFPIYSFLLFFFTAFHLHAEASDDELLYYVKAGDNYSKIANRYQLNFAELYELNKKKPLHPNTIIKIPSYFFHYIEKGDNLYQIAKLYQTTIKNIIEENPTLLSKKLFYGKRIKIPFPQGLGFINNFFSNISNIKKIQLITDKLNQDPSELTSHLASQLRGKKLNKNIFDNKVISSEAIETLKGVSLPLSPKLIKKSSYKIEQEGLIIEINEPTNQPSKKRRIGDSRVRVGTKGKVVYRGEVRGYGKAIIVEAKAGIFLVYLGLKEMLAQEDQRLEKNQTIAKIGNYLYFYIFYQDIPLDLKQLF